jgi:RimJ/RimL family protein N-acetyltransferase
MTPPYRIETERLVLRCWEPADAAALKDAMDAGVEHLLPWMPWAHDEPQTLDQKVDLLRTFRGGFDKGDDFVYAIFDHEDRRVLGGTGFHTRVGDGAFEIGYWIRAGETGRGLATESTAALTRIAFETCGVDRMEIHVEPANAGSARIPEKLGYREEARLARRLPWLEGEPRRDVVIFTMFPEEFPGSKAAELSSGIAAFDAIGRPVL